MILEHIGIFVKNRDETVDFYTKVLGFKLLRKYETDGQDVAYVYGSDNELIEIMERKTHPFLVGFAHMCLRVDDLDEAISELKKFGVELLMKPLTFEPKIHSAPLVKEEKLLRAQKPIKKPYWRIAFFQDPNGIIFELIER